MIIQPGSIIYDGDKSSYKVVEAIGNGSFGFVYKIEKESDKSTWALKTLPATFPSNEQLQGFENESLMAVKVSHKNAVNYIYIHDGTEYPQLPPYIIMDYADGGTIQNIIKVASEENRFITNEDLSDYFFQLISGMEHINSVLIHRDIKPDNILLHSGTIKITDFGLSKIVHDGTRQLTFKGFGHIRYMAPEGWKKEKNTMQMDIYSMGITFYEMATLLHPFNLQPHAEVQDWIDAHSFMNPPSPKTINPNISNAVAQIILKMMEKSTSKRYKTWDEIRKDLHTDKEPITGNSSMIDNMVGIRISADASIREKQLRQEKEQKDTEHYLKTIHYQFEKDIYKPLWDFIEEFNKKYMGGQIKMTSFKKGSSEEVHTQIQLLSRKSLTIHLKALIDNDFMRSVPMRYDTGRTIKTIERPTFRDKKILAWGYLKSNDNIGFNILLVENKDDLYGDWFILTNTNSGFGRQSRPEPIPFEFNELEKEIPLINVMHIYNTEVLPLNIEKFQEFIVLNN